MMKLNCKLQANDRFSTKTRNDITSYPIDRPESNRCYDRLNRGGFPPGFSPCHIDYILARCRQKTGHLVDDGSRVGNDSGSKGGRTMGRGKSDCGKDSTTGSIGRSAQRYAITGHTWTPAANRRDPTPWSLINARNGFEGDVHQAADA